MIPSTRIHVNELIETSAFNITCIKEFCLNQDYPTALYLVAVHVPVVFDESSLVIDGNAIDFTSELSFITILRFLVDCV